MAGQATIDREQAPPRVGRSFQSLLSDLLELTELQYRLLCADSRDAGREAVSSFLMLGAGAGFGLTIGPMCALAAAFGLHEGTGTPLWLSLLLSALVVLLISVVLLNLSVVMWRRAYRHFDRSTEELKRNAEWLRRSLGADRATDDTSCPFGHGMQNSV